MKLNINSLDLDKFDDNNPTNTQKIKKQTDVMSEDKIERKKKKNKPKRGGKL